MAAGFSRSGFSIKYISAQKSKPDDTNIISPRVSSEYRSTEDQNQTQNETATNANEMPEASNMAAESPYFTLKSPKLVTSIELNDGVSADDHDAGHVSLAIDPNCPRRPLRHVGTYDAQSLGKDFLALVEQLKEKRDRDKLMVDELSSLLRFKTEEMIENLEKWFEGRYLLTNRLMQQIGDEFHVELDTSRELEAKLVEIQSGVRILFENLQSIVSHPKPQI